MEVLFYGLKVRFTPERIHDRVLGSPAVTPGNDEAENIAGTTGRPGVTCERAGRIAPNLNRPQHINCQVSNWLCHQFDFRNESRRPNERPGSISNLLAQIRRQQFQRFLGREEFSMVNNLTLEPILVIVPGGQIDGASYTLEHLRFFSQPQIANGQHNARLSFVVIETMAMEVLKSFAEGLVSRFILAARRHYASAGEGSGEER